MYEYFGLVTEGKEVVKNNKEYFQYRASMSFFYFRWKRSMNHKSDVALMYKCLDTVIRKTLAETVDDTLRWTFLERQGLLNKLGLNKVRISKYIKDYKIPKIKEFTLDKPGEYSLLTFKDGKYFIENVLVDYKETKKVKGFLYKPRYSAIGKQTSKQIINISI